MLKRALHYVTFCLVGLFVIGCSGTDTIDNPPVPGTLPTPFPGFTFPLLDLANSQIPLPNDLLRNPQTGLLNFPGEGEPVDAANSLNGFSTSGALIIPFRGTVNANTINNDTLPVFNTTTGQRALMNYSVSQTNTGSVVTAVPVLALDHSTTYVVVTTNGIISGLSGTPILSDNAINILKGTNPLVDGNGNSTNAAISNEQAQALEPVRIGYQPIWQAAEALTGQSRADIPLAFAFTTQTLFQALPAAGSVVTAANAPLVNRNPAFPAVPAAETAPVALGHDGGPNAEPNIPTVERFFSMLPAPLNGIPADRLAGIGRIHFGSVEAPIFRNDPVEGFWSNPPVQTGTRNVPFVLFLPNSVTVPNPANAPKPVVIFQHGITGNRFQSAVLAGAVTGQDLALIAIDLELHGALKADPLANDGDGFINIPNLRNSKSNIHSSVINLKALTQAIVSGQSNVDAAPGPELAPGTDEGGVDPVYLSLSLGSIVGDLFHATEPNITASALNVGGARITNLLLQSETFRPIVVGGLAAQGVTEGSADFARFFLIAQAVIDDADPVNYADQAISGTLRGNRRAQILQQVYTSDAVVPPVSQYDMARQHANGVGAPAFAQVDALVAQALAPQASSPYAGPGFYEIPNAGHGALLDPSAGPTQQIVTQALTYLGTALNPVPGIGTIVDTGIRARQIPTELLEETTDYSGFIKF